MADEYRRFIKSSYRLADPALRAQFEHQIDDADVLVKGPYVTLAREFATANSLSEIIVTGGSLRKLGASPASDPPTA